MEPVNIAYAKYFGDHKPARVTIPIKKWSVALGATDDDINKAIFDSIKLSIDAFTGKQKLMDMKAD